MAKEEEYKGVQRNTHNILKQRHSHWTRRSGASEGEKRQEEARRSSAKGGKEVGGDDTRCSH
ncbi:hypothetical protein E2C01_098998 [Portunus trituberculatus]|uniref:Uncharacterized protein n=1 Tax=Portunus trituberculatus TaxID=210409 RepID=A0A5B7JZ58_PORTR|nr:hypothetical protein [Portunus trituberculatus]